MSARANTHSQRTIATDPPFARSLFDDVRWAWIWIPIRLYVGYEWLVAGWEKVINPAWVGPNAGKALAGFVNNSIQLTTGAHPAVQGWYAAFLKAFILPAAQFWSYVVAFGETLVGLGLILGVFTGIAAFFGIFMNTNYLLAGAVSINPILLILSVLLVLAWKTAGWWGLDRWVLVDLGTPWSPGLIFQEQATQREAEKARQIET